MYREVNLNICMKKIDAIKILFDKKKEKRKKKSVLNLAIFLTLCFLIRVLLVLSSKRFLLISLCMQYLEFGHLGPTTTSPLVTSAPSHLGPTTTSAPIWKKSLVRSASSHLGP